ncbi:MAG: UbiX family flavin prenyltransferase [Bdellovibrionales bacterium]|nr:UbiX family flavin prenyltransferase [Bdellovibrionales bacterium]
MASLDRKKWIIAVTGASGMPYAITLLQKLSLIQQTVEVDVIFSDAALRVLADEMGVKTSHANLRACLTELGVSDSFLVHNPKDIGAKPASGTALYQGMVICPCSMGTLAAVSAGLSQNLIHRAADVTLKEQRKLIVAPRETPLSLIHLRNMTTLAEMGALILPTMPGFYLQPETIQDLVDTVVHKIMDHMDLALEDAPRWAGKVASMPGQGMLV